MPQECITRWRRNGEEMKKTKEKSDRAQSQVPFRCDTGTQQAEGQTRGLKGQVVDMLLFKAAVLPVMMVQMLLCVVAAVSLVTP